MSLFIFILGTIVGSFLNVVIIRLHQRRSILGRSICVSCQQFINWYDNIPVLSWLLLKGKCRWCGSKISWQYPLVELVTGILFVLAYLQLKFSIFPPAAAPPLADNFSPLIGQQEFSALMTLLRNWIFIAVLIIIFVYDLRWYLILDIITIPAAVFAFLINLSLGLSWQSLLLGALIGGGFFLVQFLVSAGRWLGGGDIRLGVLLGVMLGWKLLLVSLFLAYIFGSIIGLGLIIFKQKKFSSKVPLGTFLSAAAIVSLLYGSKILDWYLGIIW